MRAALLVRLEPADGYEGTVSGRGITVERESLLRGYLSNIISTERVLHHFLSRVITSVRLVGARHVVRLVLGCLPGLPDSVRAFVTERVCVATYGRRASRVPCHAPATFLLCQGHVHVLAQL